MTTPIQLGMLIKREIRKRGIRADLLGSLKVKELSPSHARVTHDADLGVIHEDVLRLDSLFYELKWRKNLRQLPHADIRYYIYAPERVECHVMIDKLRRGGEKIFDFRKILLKGELGVEDTFITKMVREDFRSEDGYDVSRLLLDRPFSIVTYKAKLNEKVAGIIRTNLSKLEAYIRKTNEIPHSEKIALFRLLPYIIKAT